MDPDLLDLGISHCCDAVTEPPERGYLGILFHCHEGFDAEVDLLWDGLSLRGGRSPFRYFNTVQPHTHTPQFPNDETLGCYFVMRLNQQPLARLKAMEVKVNGTPVPVKYIIGASELRPPIPRPRRGAHQWHSVSVQYTDCRPFKCDICKEDKEHIRKPKLTCLHAMCTRCTVEWFKEHTSCPFCRTEQNVTYREA
jgi:hypothetical protein